MPCPAQGSCFGTRARHRHTWANIHASVKPLDIRSFDRTPVQFAFFIRASEPRLQRASNRSSGTTWRRSDAQRPMLCPTTTLDRKGDPRPKLQARPAQGSRICHAESLCATIVFKGSPPGMNTAERYGISSSSSHPAIATGVWFGTTPCLQPSTWLETARRKHETSTSGRLPSEHAIAPDRVGFMPIRCFGHSCPDLLILSGIFMNDWPRVAVASCLPLPPHDPAASSSSEPITGSPPVPTFEIDRRHRSPPSSSDNTVHRSVGLASKPAAEGCGSEPHPSAIGSRSDNGRPWRLQADSGCHAFKALR